MTFLNASLAMTGIALVGTLPQLAYAHISDWSAFLYQNGESRRFSMHVLDGLDDTLIDFLIGGLSLGVH